MRHLYLALIVLFSAQAIYAIQPPPRTELGASGHMPPPAGANGHMPSPIRLNDRLSISSIIDLYIIVMNDHLELSSKQKKKFEPLYTEYYNALSELSKNAVQIDNSTSDQDLETQVFESFDITDSSTELKRKYYPLFKEILSVRQIVMMYDLERELLWRISLEGERRRGAAR